MKEDLHIRLTMMSFIAQDARGLMIIIAGFGTFLFLFQRIHKKVVLIGVKSTTAAVSKILWYASAIVSAIARIMTVFFCIPNRNE